MSTSRRAFLGSVGVLGATGLASGQRLFGAQEAQPATAEFDPFEATATEIGRKYRTGRLTVRTVVERYLDRIAAYEAELDAIIRINPNALNRADELDEALESGEAVGPLHGIPLLLKDNNDTGDMPTTAGSYSLRDSTPPDDATIVAQMREAGGLVLAKANLSEFAFSYDSISSFGGTVNNPYDTDRHAGGSSGGTGAGIAANLGLIGTGTDTGGSVRVPSAACSLVGLRPTTGLISRDGIVPLALTEDTAGPMARTVADAALLTDVMVGYDPADPETSTSIGRTPHAEGKRYTDYLRLDGLESARIGVYRDYVGADEDADMFAAEDAEAVTEVFDQALEAIEAAGATVVDPVEAPSWDFVYSANVSSGDEFNRDIDSYLEGLGDDAPEDLAEIAESDEYSPAICYLRDREEVDEDAVDENLSYLQTLSRRDDLQEFVHSTFVENDLDAIVYPSIKHSPPRIETDDPWGSNAQLTPALEFPSMTVPAGFSERSGMPVGIEFMAREYEEAKLFEIAYAYEQSTQARRMPEGFGPVASSTDWSEGEIKRWNESQHKEQTVAELGGCEQ